MRSPLLFLLLVCCTSLVLASVEELTEDGFEDVLKKHKNVLLEFYTLTCTTCTYVETLRD